MLADVERGDGMGAYTIVYAQFVDIHPQAPDEVGVDFASILEVTNINAGLKNVFNRYMERTQLVTTAAGILCSDTRRTPKSIDEFTK